MGKEKGDGGTRPFSLRADVLSEWPLIPLSVSPSLPSPISGISKLRARPKSDN